MLAWVDIFNGPHVHFFQRIDAFLDSNIEAIHCTARDYYPIPVLLDLYGVEATVIGEHGGKSLYGKLIASTERMLALAQHIHEFQKKSEIGLAIHKHSVEAARVAWGLGIPSIAFLDNEIMTPQNMLVCPLARVLIAPKCIDYSVLRSFTPGHVRILQFDGVSEVANVFDHQADENVLKRLGIDTARPIAVFRSEPVLAAYNSGDCLADCITKEIHKQVEGVQIIHFKRHGESQNHVDVVDARSLYYFADIVISGGGTMAREAALLGATAFTYFNTPLAVDRYLIERGLLQAFPGKEILGVDWRTEIGKKRRKPDLSSFEHPFSLMEQAVKYLD